MNDINLLPRTGPEERTGKIKSRRAAVIIAMLVVACFAAGVYGYMYYMQSKYESREAFLQGRIKEFSTVYDLDKSIKAYEVKVKRMTEVIGAPQASTPINTKVISKIAGLMPENIFVINYSMSGTGELSLAGKSKDKESVAYFAYKLKETGFFDDVLIKSVSGKASENGNITDYNFSILITLKQ